MLLHHLSPSCCMYVSWLLCVLPCRLRGARRMGLGNGCPRPLPTLCLHDVPAATLLQGLGRALPEPRLGSHVALILFFSGPAWDILRFSSLPLWEPLSPSLHLASGNAREGAVARGAWLGTRDPHRQLGQHDERHLHPLWICTYSLSCTLARSLHTCPAPPRPAHHNLAHCSFSFIFLVRE